MALYKPLFFNDIRHILINLTLRLLPKLVGDDACEVDSSWRTLLVLIIVAILREWAQRIRQSRRGPAVQRSGDTAGGSDLKAGPRRSCRTVGACRTGSRSSCRTSRLPRPTGCSGRWRCASGRGCRGRRRSVRPGRNRPRRRRYPERLRAGRSLDEYVRLVGGAGMSAPGGREEIEEAGAGGLDAAGLLQPDAGAGDGAARGAAGGHGAAAGGVPPGKTLDSFDWGFQPQADRKRLELLGTCEFVRRTENVLFLGPPGVGKSHLAAALGMRAIKNGFRTVHYTLDDLIRLLRADDAAPPARPPRPALPEQRAADHRRSGVPSAGPDGGEPVLPAGVRALRTEFADPDLEQACAGLAGDPRRRRGADHGDPRPVAPPCPCGLDPGAQLSAARPR